MNTTKLGFDTFNPNWSESCPMAARDRIVSRSLHIPLLAVGLLVLVATVIAVLLVASLLFYAAVGLAMGVPVRGVLETLSVSRAAADLTGDLYAWLAAVLLCIVFLPLFMRYNDWLRRVLYNQEQDRTLES